MIGRALRLSAFVMTLLCAATAWAEWPPLNDTPPIDATTTQDVAVIVAVEDYLLLPDIEGAVANANEWETFFRNGMKVRDVHVLANQDATREAMLKFARTAARDVGDGGTVWWVFIGHGAPTIDGSDGLLVGMDAQRTVDSLEARGLPQGLLLNTLQSSNHNTVMVLDTSFSGRSADGQALAAGVQPVVAVQMGDFLMKSTVVLTGAQPTEVAGPLDGTSRPAFSYLMLGALRGWADANDAAVTAAEALYYTQRTLRKASGRQQTPQITGNVALVLSRGATEDKPRVVAEPLRDEPVADVDPPDTTATPASSKAALTLEYLQHRVVMKNSVARQAGRILDGPAFYHTIGRPDLAAKWRGHKPVMWASGIAMLAASGVVLGLGVAADSTGGFIAGGVTGGLGIVGGILLTTFGFVGEHHPMNYRERRLAVEEFNQRLREERGLGPEVDWQDQASDSPFSVIDLPSGPSLGFAVQF